MNRKHFHERSIEMKTKNTQNQPDSTGNKVKLNKLVLNRETVKELTKRESKNILGGLGGRVCTQHRTGCVT
jgi:hypothetical protein